MIFQWDRETGWTLLADTGEVIGVATTIPGDCWQAEMHPDFGGLVAVSTHLDDLRQWMMAEAAKVRA